jgi:hypothetical protein
MMPPESANFTLWFVTYSTNRASKRFYTLLTLIPIRIIPSIWVYATLNQTQLDMTFPAKLNQAWKPL